MNPATKKAVVDSLHDAYNCLTYASGTLLAYDRRALGFALDVAARGTKRVIDALGVES